jgi:hypothetical protein
MIGRAFASGRPVAPLPRRGTDAGGAPLDRDEYDGSELAGLGDRGIRPIEDAWAAVAFPDPGSVHADRTVVTQAAREIEICASH